MTSVSDAIVRPSMKLFDVHGWTSVEVKLRLIFGSSDQIIGKKIRNTCVVLGMHLRRAMLD